MAKRDKTARILGNLRPKTGPIVSNMILPNNSGDHMRGIKRENPVNDYDLVNKGYVDTAIAAIPTVKLNEIDNPDGNKTFNMTTRQLGFLWTNPSGNPVEFTASGAYSGALVHIHQHTGNPGAGTYLFEIESEDTDVEHIKSIGPATTTEVLCTYVGAETEQRYRLRSDGTMEWSDGTNAADTNLYRNAANQLKTDDALHVTGAITTDSTIDGMDLAAHAHTGADGSQAVAHSDTTGQTTDDHHAKSHAHNGADGSGTVAHSDTTGQTTDDHHAKSHAHNGADGSGTVAHSDTTGQTTDDHHAKSHAHNGADGSGTVAHSDTTGRTANDHHNQQHSITSTSDHTSTATPGQILKADANGLPINATNTDAAVAAAVAASHAESHTIASHSDTTATGTELNTLTDDSMADSLHRHSELSASDGSPNPAMSVNATGQIEVDYDFYFDASGSGLPYGHEYGNNINFTISSMVLSTIYNLYDASMTTGNVNLCTGNSYGGVTVQKKGVYLVIWSAGVACDTTSAQIIGGIELNSTATMQSKGRAIHEFHSTGQEVNMNGCALLDLAANDFIQIAFVTLSIASPTISIYDANLVVVQVGGT